MKSVTPVAGVLGSAGRGNTLIVNNGEQEYVLRKFTRGGMSGRLIKDTYFWSGEDETRSFAEWRLLRKLAARYLPSVILKPRKQGFTVPIGEWLHGELGDLVKRLFSSNTFKRRGIVRPQAALGLLNMHRSKNYELGHRIWSLVILEVWARVWLDGQNAEQSLLSLIKEAEG